MGYKLRDYQQNASDKAVAFLTDEKEKHNGIIVCPTGGGKSLIIADIAYRLDDSVLIFCPSKEILQQNYEKMLSICPLGCSVYSASAGQKEISKITFATIGSAINHIEEFRQFRYLLVDECHLVNSKGGMYEKFFSTLNCKILGFTATPYRLSSNSYGSMLKFLTRTRPRIFQEVIYQVQISTLLDQGFLSKMNYYSLTPVEWNEQNLKVNTTGADYTDKSVIKEYERIDFYSYLTDVVSRLLNNKKTGIKRKGILVFTRFIKEAQRLADDIPECAIVTGDTPKKEREQILSDFKSGKIKVVTNAQVLAVGFDYPELDTVVLARPTMSLALYYQQVGRAIRPHPSKECSWVIDLMGNVGRFGKVEDLKLSDPSGKGLWQVNSNDRQLTNVLF